MKTPEQKMAELAAQERRAARDRVELYRRRIERERRERQTGRCVKPGCRGRGTFNVRINNTSEAEQRCSSCGAYIRTVTV